MRFSSAITLTAVVSVLSSAHGLPLSFKSSNMEVSPEHLQLRRTLQKSGLSGLDTTATHDDILEGLGAAFEPGNSIKQLFNMVKRQLGSTDTTSNSASSSDGTTTSDASGTPSTASNTAADDITHGVGDLMGGSLDSTESAGFGFEPDNAISSLKALKV